MAGAIAGSIGLGEVGRDAAETVYQNTKDGTTGITQYDNSKRVDISNSGADALSKSGVISDKLSQFEQELDGIGGYTSQEWKTAFTYGSDRYQYNNMSAEDKKEFDTVYSYYHKGDKYDEKSSYVDEMAQKTAKDNKSFEKISDKLAEVGAQMVTIRKGDKNYDESMDTKKQGVYSVWTGSKKQLDEWLSKQNFISDGKSQKGDVTKPYMINEMSDAVKQGIVDGINDTNKTKDKKSKEETSKKSDQLDAFKAGKMSNEVKKGIIDGMNAIKEKDNNKKKDTEKTQTKDTEIKSLLTAINKKNSQDEKSSNMSNLLGNVKSINVTNGHVTMDKTSGAISLSNLTANGLKIDSATATLTGQVQMPDVWSQVKNIMPNGYAALSDKGAKDIINNEINNQIQVDDSVTMTPSFNVSAPNVNVSVKVDQSGNTSTTKQILPSSVFMQNLNSFTNKSCSQYARTNSNRR